MKKAVPQAAEPEKKSREKEKPGIPVLGTKISVSAASAGTGMGVIDLLCANDRPVHGIYQLYAEGQRLFCGYG